MLDKEILATIVEKTGVAPMETEYDDEGRLIELMFFNTPLSYLPSEIGQLANLQSLNLNGTQISSLPPEIGLLTNLQSLNLYGTQLSSLPPEIGLLTNLQSLNLWRTKLSILPSEIWQLTNLQSLSLSDTQLSSLPPEIGQLTNLQVLWLSSTPISSLPSEIWQLTNLRWLDLSDTQLSNLPPKIGQLTNLESLDLGGTQLSSLPPEIGQLTNLQMLGLNVEQFKSLLPRPDVLTRLEHLSLEDDNMEVVPIEVWQMTNLQKLWLRCTQLSSLPPEIGQLTNLQSLYLINTQLSSFPPEIGQLTNLQSLDLMFAQISSLPPEIGQLTNLQSLDLYGTQLSILPSEIGQLANLKDFFLGNNPNLLSPPPEVVEQGTEATLSFLRELHSDKVIRHEAKLLVVGEGGTGKSSLLRAMRSEGFESDLSTTHGIEVAPYRCCHPSAPETTLTLHTWDFGGQEIYHATHQFFLTQRSLYLVAWNARLGVEQGKLDYWLKTIQTLAPAAPVLLVATHIDERPPDLNYQLFKQNYPQLVGQISISNKTGEGIARLKEKLAEEAVKLPLTGQPWPGKWVKVEEALLAHPEHHITEQEYIACCEANKVETDLARGTLGSYLHDLGKILYFRDDPVLHDLVVLKPNWITKAISLVLANEKVARADGILAHQDLPQLWAEDEQRQKYDPHLYPIFLRLMERFDLSYQITQELPNTPTTHSLVPQLLPFEPPADLPPWPQTPPLDQTQVSMVYHLDFVPAGIFSWFIVRTHRYTINKHWREGVMLAYEGHSARVELNPARREISLVVWGPQPQNFFSILMHTFDLILGRFEGLKVQKDVPCICHWGQEGAKPCNRFYLYSDLVKRMEKGKQKIECPDSFEEVSVLTLLYGIHPSTEPQVTARIEQGIEDLKQGQRYTLQVIQKNQQELVQVIQQQAEWIVRNFTREWNLFMRSIEAECPNTFILYESDRKPFNPKKLLDNEYRLQLVCQHPGGFHLVEQPYYFHQDKSWWTKLRPWLTVLLRFLRFGMPFTGTQVGDQTGELERIMSSQEFWGFEIEHNLASPHEGFEEQQKQAEGAALRALHSFLKEVDPSGYWGGLQKTLTPDGNILWLCEEHHEPYRVRELVIPGIMI